MSNVFIPKKIRVGFQKGRDTYTGNLAYIIYFDARGTLRKEGSWEKWRHKDVPALDFENVPTSGFVLNKKAGGYSTGWNHRQTYCRIYDPRGLEFEIKIPNLLYILENTSSSKGKGLEGNFVYGWDGKDLLLIPEGAPEYKEHLEYSEMLSTGQTLKGKDLVLGGTYYTSSGENWIYLGRFDFWFKKWNSSMAVKKGKHYFFSDEKGEVKTVASLTNRVIKVVSDEPVENYAELMDDLEHKEIYSPYDQSKDVYDELSAAEIEKILTKGWREIVLEINGILVNSCLQVKDRDAGLYWLTSSITRVKPIYPPELLTAYNYIYAHPSGFHFDWSSSNQRYELDVELKKIKQSLNERNLDVYGRGVTLPTLIDEYKLKIRRKFLQNGKEKYQ